MDSLVVLMPAYNEEENIQAVIRKWNKALENLEIDCTFVINISGCTDNTENAILALSEEINNLNILKDSANTYGHKVLDLYRYGINQGAEYIFQTDSDDQTNPEDFKNFWIHRNEYEAIIGNREKREDGFIRLIVEKIVVLLLYIFFGIKIPDANVPFRLMKKEVVRKYIDEIPEDYSMPNILLTTIICAKKEKILFEKISFGKRQKGINKMNYKKIFLTGIESLIVFYRFRKKIDNE